MPKSSKALHPSRAVRDRRYRALARRLTAAMHARLEPVFTAWVGANALPKGELLDAVIECAALAAFPRRQRPGQAAKRVAKARKAVLTLLTRRAVSPYPVTRR